ncbi:UNVERIFIED_ORG: hypothetical protein ABIC54_006078 [Burkholderia sp. 1263]
MESRHKSVQEFVRTPTCATTIVLSGVLPGEGMLPGGLLSFRFLSSLLSWLAELFPQQPNDVFAVIPGQRHELIENADPFTERRDAIPQLQLLPSTPCVSSC